MSIILRKIKPVFCSLFSFVISAIAVERYISIFMALRYEELVSPGRVKAALTLAIGYPVVLLILFTLSSYHWRPSLPCIAASVFPPWTIHVLAGHVYLVLTAVAVLYILILQQAYAHKQRIALQNKVGCNGGNQLQNLPMSEKLGVVKNFALIVGVFAFSILPLIILSQIIVYNPSRYLQNAHMSNIYTASTFALVTHNFINPIIYALKFESYQKAFKILLGNKSSSEEHMTVLWIAWSDIIQC